MNANLLERLAWPLRNTWGLPVCNTGSPAEAIVVTSPCAFAGFCLFAVTLSRFISRISSTSVGNENHFTDRAILPASWQAYTKAVPSSF